MKFKAFIILIITFIILAFGKKQFELIFPSYFPVPIYNLNNNPIDSATIELGRVLFFDPILSKDHSISCASCHSPYNAFAHTDHDLSHGINDQIGNRNAPALFNLAWHKTFMWDGAINHLDVQALAPISHEKEMGETISNVVLKLKSTSIYPTLFLNAFRDSSITGEKVLKSLSQFQLTLISSNSKYDRVKQGVEEFSEQEKKGYLLFQQNCNSCHTEPLFSNYKYANNGLPIDTTLNDYGRITISQQKEDSLLFKIPSLRNLSYSYPYMHDGRFKKLNQVLNHYTDGINQSSTLSKELRNPILLSPNDKVDLIAFLLTLNDKEFVFNSKHQYPKNILTPTEGN
ncbi:MAG: cytochrome-c peroxidase [Flavobacteriales bacterium]